MGACDFIQSGRGKTAQEAFSKAVQHAQYMSGHGGYTGTIAEKREFVMVTSDTLDERDAVTLAQKLLDEDDHRITDKWGPAGCIRMGEDHWLFFGWASS